MFTPQEVSEKVFPKASFGGGGYNMASVDEFLDALTEDYTALFKENVTLKAKLKVLAEKVEEYRSTEEAMRKALMTAQRMADTENQTRFLMMERVETRLSAYLLSLYLLSGGAADLEIPMKMKDLSAYLGTTPETLSRKLHLLEETNLISRKGKKIHITDREELKQMAEG